MFFGAKFGCLFILPEKVEYLFMAIIIKFLVGSAIFKFLKSKSSIRN